MDPTTHQNQANPIGRVHSDTTPIGDHGKSRPEWASAKIIGHLLGIPRSTLYQLAKDGRIRTASFRKRGQIKAKRLFSYDSVLKFIEDHEVTVPPSAAEHHAAA